MLVVRKKKHSPRPAPLCNILQEVSISQFDYKRKDRQERKWKNEGRSQLVLKRMTVTRKTERRPTRESQTTLQLSRAQINAQKSMPLIYGKDQQPRKKVLAAIIQ